MKDKAQAKKLDINLRSKTCQSLFQKQPDATKEKYKQEATKRHKVLLTEWELNLSRPASKDPEARQQYVSSFVMYTYDLRSDRCIDGVPSLVQPLLDLLSEFTGMPGTLIMGGPEPADGGRLNVIR